MRLSANEVQRLARKAATGAGAPAGLDDDAGRAAEWLELRGRRGLVLLLEDLKAGCADADRCRPRRIEPDRLVFDDASSFLVGGVVTDWALSGGALSGRAGARIEGVRSVEALAAFLEPAGWRAESDGRGVQLMPGMARANAKARSVAERLLNGVEVEDAVYDGLNEFARNTLVPASALSRSRGAGAEVDDNE